MQLLSSIFLQNMFLIGHLLVRTALCGFLTIFKWFAFYLLGFLCLNIRLPGRGGTAECVLAIFSWLNVEMII